MKRKHVKYGALIGLLLVVTLMVSGMFASSPIDATKKQNLDLSLTDTRFYIDESNYLDSMNQVVVPYIEQYKTSGYFTTSDNANIYYTQYLLEEPKGHIAISHGFTEFSQKYYETIYYFLMEGYNVSILEHRGHGHSDRLIDDPSKVYIEDFDTYISDFKTFMDTVVQPTLDNKPCYLYAHSMGGAIGARFLEEYPGYFDAAVLSSPMLEIATGGVPIPLAKLIAKTATITGFGKSYVFGQKAFEAVSDFENAPTTSKARYDYALDYRLNDTMYQLNAATFSWLNTALNGSKAASENSHLVEIPVLVFQSENDTFVQPGGQNKFVNNAPNATLVFAKNAKHELYCETQEIMVPYFNTIFNFFNSIQVN